MKNYIQKVRSGAKNLGGLDIFAQNRIEAIQKLFKLAA